MNVIMDSTLDVDKALEFAKNAPKNRNTPSKTKRTYEAKPTTTRRRRTISVNKSSLGDASNASSLSHGTMIRDEHGIGIVVDRDHNLRKLAENDAELQLMKAVMDPNDALFDNIQFTSERLPGEETQIEEYIRKNPFSEEALKLNEVRKAFKDWDLCAMDENGAVLAPSGSPQCIAYKEAMDAVRSGKIRLPTVAEYEAQKRRAAKMAAEKMQDNKITRKKSPSKNQQTNNPQPQPKEVKVEELPKNEPVPENKSTDKAEIIDLMQAKIKLMEEAQNMTLSEQQVISGEAAPDPMVAASVAKNKPSKQEVAPAPAVPAPKQPDPPIVAAPDPMVAATKEPAPEPKKPAVLDLAAAEMEVAMKQAENVVEEEAPDDSEAPIVLEVPSDKAATFMENLPEDIKEKVTASKKINVIYAKDVTLPNAVKRISNITQYHRVAPKNIGDGVTQVVLINSGYVAYLRPVGSLEWSMISPIRDDAGGVEYPDVGKIAQFVYSHLVTTSLGKMSYAEFVENTAYEDLNHMLYTLLRASQPDEQNVIFTCQRETCQKDYAAKYKISELPDYDKMTQEAREQVARITDAKDIIEDAKEVHEESPVMRKLVYDAKSTKTMFILKNFDIATIVDRMPILEAISREYGETVAILIQFTNEVYIKVADTGNEEEDWSISTDPAVIAEEYFRIDNEDKDNLADVLEGIPRFDPIQYSIKGPVKCTHCGNVIINPTQNVQDLVFHIALMARYHG